MFKQSLLVVLLAVFLFSSNAAVGRVLTKEEQADDGAAALAEKAKLSSLVDLWPPAKSTRTPAASDLHHQYSTIFQHGNRNAASHLWASFLLDRSTQFESMERLEFYMTAFCIVSGSPVRPSDYNRYRLTLPFVGSSSSSKKNSTVTGYLHYCCWPCVCDTQDFIKIDTLTVQLADGSHHKRYFAVIGNPCDHQDALEEPFTQPFYGGRRTTLKQVAPQVRCGADGSLEGATVSDHGYVILGMFLDAELVEEEEEGNSVAAAFSHPEPGRISTLQQPNGKSLLFQDEREWEPQCRERAENGYNSGMGEIFRKVSAISPVVVGTASVASVATPISTDELVESSSSCKEAVVDRPENESNIVESPYR